MVLAKGSESEFEGCRSVYIYSSFIDILDDDAVLILGAEFHPCSPFFLRYPIPLETIGLIRTCGVFETTNFLRETIKRVDDLLSVGGRVEIDYFSQGDPYVSGGSLRSISFMMNEWSICTEGRFRLEVKAEINNGYRLVYRKLSSKFAEPDDIRRWSFGIVSDGRNNGRVRGIIGEIKRFGIPEIDVMVCGPSPYVDEELPEYVRILPDADLYSDLRVPISKKKNRIIDSARYDNLVLMHDRISFESDWYDKICAHGNSFDVLCPQILAKENNDLRVQDWLEFNGEFGELKSFGRQMSYDEWSPRVYVDGGLLIAKVKLLRKIRYSSLLHWGEGEDVDLARRLYQAGALISLYTGLRFRSETYRHKGTQIKSKNDIWSFIRLLCAKIISRAQRKKQKALRKRSEAFSEFCESNKLACKNS